MNVLKTYIQRLYIIFYLKKKSYIKLLFYSLEKKNLFIEKSVAVRQCRRL